MKNSIQRIAKFAVLFYVGGSAYLTIEIFYRNYTHFSMFIVGGTAFILVGGINNYLPWTMGLAKQALIGSVIITAVELIAGLIINLWLGLGVWDYSAMPLNILGQICLPYTGAWFLLSIVGIFLDDYLRWKLYAEEKPRYFIF